MAINVDISPSAKDLAGNFAVDVPVVSGEDHTHPTAVDFLDDAVVGEPKPDKRA